MRWLWIDRFVELISGQRAVAIKNVSIVEEEIDEYWPNYPLYPASLLVEGLAQAGGLLVAETSDFRERVVLAKLGRATFHRSVLPGDRLILTATLQDLNKLGAVVQGTVDCEGERIAEVELVFAQLDERFPGRLFEPAEILRILRLFRVYEVAVTAEGAPLPVPAYLLEAEREACRNAEEGSAAE